MSVWPNPIIKMIKERKIESKGLFKIDIENNSLKKFQIIYKSKIVLRNSHKKNKGPSIVDECYFFLKIYDQSSGVTYTFSSFMVHILISFICTIVS